MPTIRFNNSTGSDTTASGSAGAITASGTAASYSGSVVTLDGSPDLSGFDADDDVLWLATSTGRRFFDLSAADNSAKTVTTVNAPLGTASGLSWGIGGKRASLAGSPTLYASTPDIKGGWVIELCSGYTESFSSQFNFYNGASLSTGKCILRTEAGWTTRAKLTTTLSGPSPFVARSNGWELIDIQWINGGAVSTSLFDAVASLITVSGCRFATEGGTWSANTHVMENAGGAATYAIVNCEVDATGTSGTAHGIYAGDAVSVINCYVHGAASHGVLITGSLGPRVTGCVIASNGGDGINWNYTGNAQRSGSIKNCVIYDNGSDGIEITGVDSDAWNRLEILQNVIESNAGYGINISGATNAAETDYYSPGVDYNAYYGNTSGPLNKISHGAHDIAGGVNGYTVSGSFFSNAAAGDWNLNSTANAGQLLRDLGRAIA